MLVAFVTGVLVEGFSTLIAKSFNTTGRVAATPRRLMQNNRQLMEIFLPGSLAISCFCPFCRSPSTGRLDNTSLTRED